MPLIVVNFYHDPIYGGTLDAVSGLSILSTARIPVCWFICQGPVNSILFPPLSDPRLPFRTRVDKSINLFIYGSNSDGGSFDRPGDRPAEGEP